MLSLALLGGLALAQDMECPEGNELHLEVASVALAEYTADCVDAASCVRAERASQKKSADLHPSGQVWVRLQRVATACSDPALGAECERLLRREVRDSGIGNLDVGDLAGQAHVGCANGHDQACLVAVGLLPFFNPVHEPHHDTLCGGDHPWTDERVAACGYAALPETMSMYEDARVRYVLQRHIALGDACEQLSPGPTLSYDLASVILVGAFAKPRRPLMDGHVLDAAKRWACSEIDPEWTVDDTQALLELVDGDEVDPELLERVRQRVRAVEVPPLAVFAFVNLEERDKEGARRFVTDLAAYQPDHVVPALVEADSLGEKGQYEEKLRALEALAKMNEGQHDILVALADTYTELGRHDDRLAAAEALLQLDEDDVWAMTVRMTALASLERWEEALAVGEAAIERHYGRTLLNNLAWLYATAPDANLRDGQRCLDVLARLSKSPGSTELDTQAACLAELGRFDEAVALFDYIDSRGWTKPFHLQHREWFEAGQAVYRASDGKPERPGPATSVQGGAQ